MEVYRMSCVSVSRFEVNLGYPGYLQGYEAGYGGYAGSAEGHAPQGLQGPQGQGPWQASPGYSA